MLSLADRRLLCALARYLSATYIMSLVNCYADARADALGDERGHQALPDLGFDLVPENRELLWTLDFLNNAQAVFLILSVLRCRERLSVTTRFMDMHSALLLLRCLTVASTSMPSPVPCRNLVDITKTHILLAPLRHLARADALMSWCHDFMFSGHATFAVLAAWFVVECKPHQGGVVLAVATCPVSLVVLLATRSHYTSDIVVGVVLASLVYWLQRFWDKSRGDFFGTPGSSREFLEV